MFRFIKRIFKRALPEPEKWFLNWFNQGGESLAGVMIDEWKALNYSAVYACVRLLSNTVASLPLILYRRLPNGGKERAKENPLYKLFHYSPNPEITAFRFYQTMVEHVALWGNGYAFIDWGPDGNPRGLYIMRPNRMKLLRKDGKLIYEYYNYETNLKETYTSDYILHIPGFGYDGVKGYSIVSLARESFGLGLATEEFGARFFGSGTHPSAIFEHPGKIRKENFDDFKKYMKDAYEGLGKSHRGMVLEEGMKAVFPGVPPEDAQFLETRKFQKNEVASWFNIPPHMIGDLERATFSNIEQQSLEFVIHTIRPWLILFEQEQSRKFILDRDKYFLEYLVDALLRGDIESRYRAYATGRQWGWLSADDILAMENRNPLPDGQGKIYLVPMNMVPANQLTMPDYEPESYQRNERLLKPKMSYVDERRKIGKQYIERFEERARRIVRAEIREIKKGIEKFLKRRNNPEFESWLEDYYEKNFNFVKNSMKPVLSTFSKDINENVSKEIDVKIDEVGTDKFIDGYANVFAKRHNGSSKNQILKLMRDVEGKGNGVTIEQSVLDRLESWDETRPGRIAMRETVECLNAVTLNAYKQSGIRITEWVTFGKTCPFCSSLDGKKMQIEKAYVSQGDKLGEGVEILQIENDMRHAPIHQGCDCGITVSV